MTAGLPGDAPREDLVLHGGRVYPMIGAPVAQAVAVADGRIVAVGADDEVLAAASTARRIDLGGRAVLPGLNESHMHGGELGALWPRTVFGPDGAFEDTHRPLLHDRGDRREALRRTGELLATLGVTSYTDAGLGPGEDAGITGCFGSEVFEEYRGLHDAGSLRQRVTVLGLFGEIDGPSRVDEVVRGIAGLHEWNRGLDPRWLNVRGVKLFADLIPPMRSAWTAHTYDDGGHGDLLVEGDTLAERAAGLRDMILAGDAAGLQVAVHATGDRAVQALIDALETVPRRGLGHYVIHGDLTTPEQLRRMAELGIGLNTQPGIAELTRGMVAAVLGERVADAAWDLAAALDEDVLALSTDAPVLAPDWRQAIAAADARLRRGEAADGGAEAERRLLRLLRAYTVVPARQDGAEAWKGTIEPGKVADLAVLAGDPVETGAQRLPELDVDLTIVDGRIVFDRAGR